MFNTTDLDNIKKSIESSQSYFFNTIDYLYDNKQIRDLKYTVDIRNKTIQDINIKYNKLRISSDKQKRQIKDLKKENKSLKDDILKMKNDAKPKPDINVNPTSDINVNPISDINVNPISDINVNPISDITVNPYQMNLKYLGLGIQ